MTFSWTVSEVGRALGVPAAHPGSATEFSAVSTDSRSLPPGALFVALKGDRFDGHDFLSEVVARGAAGVVVSESRDLPDGVQVFRVPDTLVALGDLARHYRDTLGARVVGITGSAGKTTTKDFLQAMTRGSLRVHATPGNLNNRIGLPSTVLGAPADTELLILEMGTNEPGEIETLASIARPGLAVVTTVGETHLEKLGSLDGVLNEKLDLLRGLVDGGIAFVGDEPPVLAQRARQLVGRVRVAGWSSRADADLRPRRAEFDEQGRFRFEWEGQQVRLLVPGRHSVSNALLALAVARNLGIPARDAAGRIQDVLPGRMRTEIRMLGGLTLLVDCYNASPQSVEAALGLLASIGAPGRKVAVLGTMLELGEDAEAIHRRVLEKALARGLDLVVATGLFADPARSLEASASGPELWAVADPDEAGRRLLEELDGSETVLLKASRGIALERLIPGLELRFGNSAPGPETRNGTADPLHPSGKGG